MYVNMCVYIYIHIIYIYIYIYIHMYANPNEQESDLQRALRSRPEVERPGKAHREVKYCII